MDELKPIDLKAILHSKRANMYYLEHCRVMVNKGRVEYVTEEGNRNLYFNIPIANTTFILLGTGTSVTQAAVREFSKAGVLIGFCGSNGSPLFSCNDYDDPIEWIAPVSEYRPTSYIQEWIKIFYDDDRRFEVAKQFQKNRILYIHEQYALIEDFEFSNLELNEILSVFSEGIDKSENTQELLLAEARVTKSLYKLISTATISEKFKRERNSSDQDLANRFLDHGNYLAYGIAATAAWVLGLPFALAVLHGKTRRGALVFDLADLIKDAIVLPTAFICAQKGYKDTVFREICMRKLKQANAMDYIIDNIKAATSGQ